MKIKGTYIYIYENEQPPAYEHLSPLRNTMTIHGNAFRVYQHNHTHSHASRDSKPVTKFMSPLPRRYIYIYIYIFHLAASGRVQYAYFSLGNSGSNLCVGKRRQIIYTRSRPETNQNYPCYYFIKDILEN